MECEWSGRLAVPILPKDGGAVTFMDYMCREVLNVRFVR